MRRGHIVEFGSMFVDIGALLQMRHASAQRGKIASSASFGAHLRRRLAYPGPKYRAQVFLVSKAGLFGHRGQWNVGRGQ
jgi:hypothetical protein